MPYLLRRLVSASLLASTLSATATADPAPAPSAPPPPTIEEFARGDLMSGASISPDGRHYAAIVSWEPEQRGIVVMDIDENKRVGGLRGGADLNIYRLLWHGSDRLLFQISKENLYAYGVFSAPLAKLDNYIPIVGLDVVAVLAQPRARPDRVMTWTLASFQDRGRPGLVNELRVTRSIDNNNTPELGNLQSRPVQRYPDLPGLAMTYVTDREGELAYGISWLEEKAVLVPWQSQTKSWGSPLPLGLGSRWPIGADAEPGFVWMAETGADGSRLRRMNLTTGDLEPPIHTEKQWDLAYASPLFSRPKGKLVGLRIAQQRIKHVWFDPAFAELQRSIEEQLPKEEDHLLVGADEQETRFMVRSTGPRQPGVHHVFDRATGRLLRAAEAAPHLPPARLRTTNSVRFKSRDGLSIEAYVTLPAGASKDRPAPLVVYAHGGPIARDFWAYDHRVQFLASRGYAVLQPNYRGSAGFVWPDQETIAGDFSGMRDDVIDATRSALRSGLFDPQRVAIMGGSFGGYLALACSVEEPDLYQAAVSFAGVFDWARQIGKPRPTEEPSAGLAIWRQLLGDPKRDRDRFESISVVNRLDRLKAPVLLAHGRIDRVVEIEQTERLVRGLSSRKHPHQVHYFRNASHGLAAEADRVAYLREVEGFLARHLAARPSGAPALD